MIITDISILRKRLATVEEENEALKIEVKELRDIAKAPTPTALCRRLKLTPLESDLLGLFLPGKVVSADAFFRLLYRSRSKQEPRVETYRVMVCKLRGKLRPIGVLIANTWGRGYFMDAAAIEKLKQLEAA